MAAARKAHRACRERRVPRARKASPVSAHASLTARAACGALPAYKDPWVRQVRKASPVAYHRRSRVRLARRERQASLVRAVLKVLRDRP
jgi:hypothetical protein